MVEFEADDALAAAAVMAVADPRVEQVVICTPDKDLAQCVRGDRIVQLDRRTRELRNEAGVQQKFGVLPESIPDWLALVGDSADGFPGLPGWGARSAAMVLARYRHLEAIPTRRCMGRAGARRSRLATTLTEQRDRALLFRSWPPYGPTRRSRPTSMGCAGRDRARFPELGRAARHTGAPHPSRDAGRRARGRTVVSEGRLSRGAAG